LGVADGGGGVERGIEGAGERTELALQQVKMPPNNKLGEVRRPSPSESQIQDVSRRFPRAKTIDKYHNTAIILVEDLAP